MNDNRRVIDISNSQEEIINQPWDKAPTNASRPIMVLVHDLKLDVIEKEVKLDYGSYEDRKTLGRLTFWAITNGRSVETISVDEWERMNKE